MCLECAKVKRDLETRIRRGDGTPAELRQAMALLEQNPPLGQTVHARLTGGGKVWVCPRHVDTRFLKRVKDGWQLDLDAADAPRPKEIEIARG